MTMQITKSWFYNLEDFWEISRFEISDWLKIIALDNWKTSKEIIVWKDVDLKICWFLEKEENYEIVFRQIWEKSNLEVNYLNLAKDSEKIKAKILFSKRRFCFIYLLRQLRSWFRLNYWACSKLQKNGLTLDRRKYFSLRQGKS